MYSLLHTTLRFLFIYALITIEQDIFTIFWRAFYEYMWKYIAYIFSVLISVLYIT